MNVISELLYAKSSRVYLSIMSVSDMIYLLISCLCFVGLVFYPVLFFAYYCTQLEVNKWISVDVWMRLMQLVQPLQNTTFEVVFLARQVGSIENTLYIHSSRGSFKYQVRTLHGVLLCVCVFIIQFSERWWMVLIVKFFFTIITS